MAGSVARAVGGACSTTALTLPVVRTALPQCAQPAWPASCLASTLAALQELRALLQSSLRSAEAAEVFAQLFASWTHSCAASLALALLAQAHSLACELLAVMASEPLSMRPETTVQLSQLVSLLEAPAFAPLRLQLPLGESQCPIRVLSRIGHPWGVLAVTYCNRTHPTTPCRAESHGHKQPLPGQGCDGGWWSCDCSQTDTTLCMFL